MGYRLGIIAGSGESPAILLKEAQKKGHFLVVAGIRGEANPGLEAEADIFEWFDVFEIERLVSFFKHQDICKTVFSGKVEHRRIYEKGENNRFSEALLGRGSDRSPSVLIHRVIDYLAEQKIETVDPGEFFASAFCGEGILTKREISGRLEDDIDFGWKMAKKLADLDIGQTIVVKDKAIVALEGMEGTDETIKRGGQLAGEGTVVVKVSRSSQDPRIDLPAVGIHTVESLIHSGGEALVLEADKVLFFQREEAVALADAHNITIIAKRTLPGRLKKGKG